jgi:acyl-CoA synthetase (AMP-forming)/AMP-acid ligase II
VTSASSAPDLPRGAGNTIVAQGFRGTWAELPEAGLPPVAAALVDGHLAAAGAAWEHARTARETLVTGAARVGEEQAEELRRAGFDLVSAAGRQPATATRAPTKGRLWLLTSGSTGRPKRVAHTLQSLTTVAAEQPARRWLCPYTPGSYAWWQVVTLSLSHPGQDVVFVEPDGLSTWPELALAEGVTAASGTPTFWRHALWAAGDTVARLPLEQVTLGGEPVDQAILDRLAQVFPTARLSWIYASSEAGASIAVHDGRAGFPVSWLDRSAPGRPRLTVEDHELLIESGWSADGFAGPLRTGDRAQVVDGRVHITGRIGSDEINVGGSKVSASAVRAALLAHPSVAWAQARARRAPLVGSVVAADVVLGAPATTAELTRWCTDRLPHHAVPRRIRLLDEIPIKETLKSDV